MQRGHQVANRGTQYVAGNDISRVVLAGLEPEVTG